jgi:hypothetical protein
VGGREVGEIGRRGVVKVGEDAHEVLDALEVGVVEGGEVWGRGGWRMLRG